MRKVLWALLVSVGVVLLSSPAVAQEQVGGIV